MGGGNFIPRRWLGLGVSIVVPKEGYPFQTVLCHMRLHLKDLDKSRFVDVALCYMLSLRVSRNS